MLYRKTLGSDWSSHATQIAFDAPVRRHVFCPCPLHATMAQSSWWICQAAKSMNVELYTIPGCPYCAAAREDLDWRGVEYVEYDVEQDREAYTRMLALTGGNHTVPVLVEPGKPPQIGWGGRGCFI